MQAGKTARRLRWALLLTGVVAVALVAFTGWQALKAKDALELVASDFQTLSGQLKAGDRTGSHETLEQAQGHAETAQENTTGPGWWLTSRLPGVGDNVVAVRTVAGTVDTLARDVLPPVVEAAEILKPANLRPTKGRIDLRPLAEVAPAIVEADRLLQDQEGAVAALRPNDLAPQIARPVRLLQRKLADAASLSNRASRALQLLPPMLGADGPRTYLLLFQNNAEVRATGGIPGAFATVTAKNGRISLGQQGDASTIGRFENPPVRLTADEKALYGLNMGRYPQDVNFTPDFPRSAELVRAMWNARHGVQVDGVASADPVALSYLLRGTGPVPTIGGAKLTADNAVKMLLSEVYAQIPEPEQQNAYFAAVARSIFGAVSGGQGDPQKVLEGLTHGAAEGRILLWSARPDEQALIAPTALSGSLAHEQSDQSPRVGVFLNDGTGAKMDYYLDYTANVEPVRCQGERQVLDVTLSMSSTAPRGGEGLPDYVANTSYGVPRGTIRTTVSAYAPIGGYVDGTALGDTDLSLDRLAHDGRSLVMTTLDLAPGESQELHFTMVSGPGQDGRPELRVTPGVHGSGLGSVGPSAC